MKIFHSGDKVWNYIKQEMIDIDLLPCPKCSCDPIAVDLFANDHSSEIIGHGYIKCSNQNCGCKTRCFYTDSGYSSKMGIEKAQDKWNNRDMDWFEDGNIYGYE